VKAVVYSGYGATPVLTEVPDPGCPADGVVITVGATGVCRSDWHAWKGHDPVALPHIGGHEFAGVVATAGPGVRRWRAGDRVTVPFACGCGRCEHCLAGDAQVCPRQTQPGFTGPGSFAELVAVHAADANLVALPGGPVPLPMDLVIARELEIYGSHGMAARTYPAMLAMVADGTLRPGLLIGDVIGLEDVGQALAAMDGLTPAGMTVVRLAAG
jgi:D-arabinose 1-dehydrogenase-like Zn-dependent alcohol dehydrogenase